MLVQKHIVFLLFVFCLNLQLSFSSSFSNVTLPNNSRPLTSCHPSQSHALLQFISNFTIETCDFYGCLDGSYPKTESWKEGTDCCSSWDGVKCDDVTGHVIEVDLSFSQLRGIIHFNSTLFSSHIAPYLHRLNLAYNYFYGSEISSEFWVKFGSSLTHLNLSNTGFTGNISSEKFNPSNLVSLDLSYTHLRIESEVLENLSHLRVLNLDRVNMSSLHVSSLMNLSSSLTSLHLRGCDLQGEFPFSLLVFPNLQELDLSFNMFNPITSLPYFNSTCSNLLFLDMSGTSFSLSSSPIALFDFAGNCFKSLRHLDLSQCNISGSIPPSLGNFTKLTYLDIGYNNLRGPISSTLDNLTKLTYLDIGYNLLSGPISPSLDTLIELTYLDLSRNNLSGPIPLSLGNLIELTNLRLSLNHLSGPIPPSFGNLTQLTSLAIIDNFLSGPVPPSFGNLVELTYIDLSSNNLSGPIPTSFSNLTQLVNMDLNYNEFEGLLSSFLFDLPSLQEIRLSHNKLHGPIPPIKSMQLGLLDLSHNNISTGGIDISYSLPSFTDLDLSSCNFNQFPPFIKALTNLAFLNISNNQLQGPIPDWIFNVGKDTLSTIDLSVNQLTKVGSPIHWKNVEFIDLNSNSLRGSLPILPTTITFFSVFNNSLSGEVSSVFCNTSSIEFIDLSNNHFTGLIPQCLGRLKHLVMLNLGINNFHGAIPNSFRKKNSLNYLILRRNNLRGKLPKSLVNCHLLQILDASENKIEDTFPYWLYRVPSLEILVLRSNKFFGSLNSFKGKHVFPMVRILDLSNNSFTGGLPIRLVKNLNLNAKMGDTYMEMLPNDEDRDHRFLGGSSNIWFGLPGLNYPMVIIVKGLQTEYKKIMTTLAIIDLSRNKFEGHIPDMIGKLVSLNGLNLSHNLLTGHIPPSIGNLINLEWLDLSSNKLSGHIPGELANLTFLEVLNLSHNQLGGSIPQGKQLNTFTNDSYRDNLDLCGFPLSKACGLSHGPPQVASKDTDYSDSESGFNWGVAFAGYGCGIVFGLSMGYIMFTTRTPNWFVKMFDGQKAGKRTRRCVRRRN